MSSESWQTIVFSDIEAFSFSRFFKNDNHGPQVKGFYNLELYFFRLKKQNIKTKQKGVICGKEDDNVTTFSLCGE